MCTRGCRCAVLLLLPGFRFGRSGRVRSNVASPIRSPSQTVHTHTSAGGPQTPGATRSGADALWQQSVTDRASGPWAVPVAGSRSSAGRPAGQIALTEQRHLPLTVTATVSIIRECHVNDRFRTHCLLTWRTKQSVGLARLERDQSFLKAGGVGSSAVAHVNHGNAASIHPRGRCQEHLAIPRGRRRVSQHYRHPSNGTRSTCATGAHSAPTARSFDGRGSRPVRPGCRS